MMTIYPVRPRRITAPAFAPVSLSEMKRQIGISELLHIHDAFLEQLCSAACDLIEQDTGLVLAQAEYELVYHALPQAIELPIRPVSSAEIEYRDQDGVWQSLPSAQWLILAPRYAPTITPRHGVSWPAVHGDPDSVRVRCVAGFESASEIPPRARQAVLLLVGHWFAQRDPVQPAVNPQALPPAYSLLVTSLRGGVYP